MKLLFQEYVETGHNVDIKKERGYNSGDVWWYMIVPWENNLATHILQESAVILCV